MGEFSFKCNVMHHLTFSINLEESDVHFRERASTVTPYERNERKQKFGEPSVANLS